MAILPNEFKGFPSERKIKQMLASWDSTSKYLRFLSPDEIKRAIKQENNRPDGPRMNIVTRLIQRYDRATKSLRWQELLNYK